MATLVHDDLIDGAEVRRGKASAWSVFGAGAARAAGDYLFARAFAELAATGDARAVGVLADAALCLARGEALQRRQTHDPDTTVESYLERCALKTGKLFEAACLLGAAAGGASGSRSGSRSRSPTTSSTAPARRVETGKIAGTDLREGRRRCRCSSRRARTRSSGARSPAASSTARSSGSRRRARSSGRARSRSSTRGAPART